MMFYKSSGRNLWPRGFKVDKALQVALLLAVCIWLLYQTKHDKPKSYGGNRQSKVIKEHATIFMGRKVNVGFLVGTMIETDGWGFRDVEGREDGGNGDIEFLWNTGKKEGGKRLEGTDNELLCHGEAASDKGEGEEELVSIVSHDNRINEMKPQTNVKEPQPFKIKEGNADIQVKEEEDKVNSNKGGEHDSVRTEEIQEKIALQNSEIANQGDMKSQNFRFLDENGVPPDGLDRMNSIFYESIQK